MPAYQASTVNRHTQQAVPGFPAYLLGSYDYTTADTVMVVTNVALATNVATVSARTIAGKNPVAGQRVSITGTTPGGGAFNVSDAVIISASFNATTGVGTFTYAVTHADVPSVAASGEANAPVPEVGESLVAGASAALALQANTGPNNGQDVRFDISITSTPSTTITVQAAMIDQNDNYVNITNAGTGGTAGSFTVSAAGTQSFTAVDLRARFVRFNVGTVTGGTLPTIIGKVLV